MTSASKEEQRFSSAAAADAAEKEYQKSMDVVLL
jgi:hypothetical protein